MLQAESAIQFLSALANLLFRGFAAFKACRACDITLPRSALAREDFFSKFTSLVKDPWQAKRYVAIHTMGLSSPAHSKTKQRKGAVQPKAEERDYPAHGWLQSTLA